MRLWFPIMDKRIVCVWPTTGWSIVITTPVLKSNQNEELCLIKGYLDESVRKKNGIYDISCGLRCGCNHRQTDGIFGLP